MRRLRFIQHDVFTSKPFEGNQLAVFTDGRGLSDTEMQRIAKEINFSETTFIVPRDEAAERERGVQVRIFTVEEELPFAGHPTLGTAAVLRKLRGRDHIDLELKVGKIPVTFESGKGDLAYGEMRQRDPEFGHIHKRKDIAKIGGIIPDDLREDVPIQSVSTGNPFVIIGVKSLATLKSLRFNAAAAAEYAQGRDFKFFFWVTTETANAKVHAQARMIFYNGEDPATGSACGPAAAWMVKYGLAKSNERVMIEQGIEIGRPSQIFVTAENTNGSITNVRVGGYSVEVAQGEYFLP